MALQSSLSVASDYQSKELQLTAEPKVEDLFLEISSARADVTSNLNLCQAVLDCITEKMVVVIHQSHAPEKTPMGKKKAFKDCSRSGSKEPRHTLVVPLHSTSVLWISGGRSELAFGETKDFFPFLLSFSLVIVTALETSVPFSKLQNRREWSHIASIQLETSRHPATAPSVSLSL